MIQNGPIDTVERQQKLGCSLSNGAIFNDLEWPSRSRRCLTSNNLKTVEDRAVLTMADQKEIVYYLSNCAIFNDLERPP